MRDFTFIYDGNDKYNDDGSINFDLLALVYERMQEIIKYQSVSYTIPRNDKMQKLIEKLADYDYCDEVGVFIFSFSFLFIYLFVLLFVLLLI